MLGGTGRPAVRGPQALVGHPAPTQLQSPARRGLGTGGTRGRCPAPPPGRPGGSGVTAGLLLGTGADGGWTARAGRWGDRLARPEGAPGNAPVGAVAAGLTAVPVSPGAGLSVLPVVTQRDVRARGRGLGQLCCPTCPLRVPSWEFPWPKSSGQLGWIPARISAGDWAEALGPRRRPREAAPAGSAQGPGVGGRPGGLPGQRVTAGQCRRGLGAAPWGRGGAEGEEGEAE